MTEKIYPRLLLIRTGLEFEQRRTRTKSGYSRAGFKYVRKDDHVEFYNVKKGADTSAPVKGYRSILRLEVDKSNAIEYDAIERANGFTHVPEGIYTRAYMQPRARFPSNQEIYVTGAIFIHSAEYPEFLDGCIGPGKSVDDGGVKQSNNALEEIIEGLGGWKAGRFVRLEVRGFKDLPGR